MTAFIGDYVLVRSNDYHASIPQGIPLKVLGVELNPSSNPDSWKDCPASIIGDNDPFYALELPHLMIDKSRKGVGYVKMNDCEKFKPEKYDKAPNLEVVNVSEMIIENDDSMVDENVESEISDWDDDSDFYNLE